MCRMLTATGNIPMRELVTGLQRMAADQNEDHERNTGIKGTYTHGDGWGAAYLLNNEWVVIKSTEPVWNDPLAERLKTIKTNFLILHARRGTKGNKNLNNTHPFIQKHKTLGETVFVHNGTINHNIIVPNEQLLIGQTDSERLFHAILSELRPGKEIETIKGLIHPFTDFTAANTILATPSTAFITNRWHHKDKLYTMKIGQGQGYTVVSSEIIPELNLTYDYLTNGEIISLDIQSSTVKRINPQPL